MGGTGHSLDRGINLNAEDSEPTDIDNESTYGSDAKIALGGPEAEGYHDDPIYNNQDKLKTLMGGDK